MPSQRDALLRLSDAELLAQCEVDRFRASGRGGQKRNKTESAIRLRHKPTDLIAIATKSRSQHANRARALRRLRAQVAFQVREPADLVDYQPPEALVTLLRGGTRRRGPRERRAIDYLAGMAALLDVFVATDCSVRDTAEVLGSSTGALSRLLLGDARVARKANELRSARGMHPLRG